MNPLGYLIEENVFTPDECFEILDSIQPAMANENRGGFRHLMSNPTVRKFATDVRLLSIVQAFVGKRVIPFKATLFSKTGKANWLVAWHQDTTLPLANWTMDVEWGPWSTKAGIRFAHSPAWALTRVVALRIQLDASDSTNGPLRVIERSHLGGILDSDEISQTVREGQHVTCLTDMGGIIVMSPLIVHASSKAASNKPRRVLHIEYADTLDLAPGIRLATA